MLDKRVKPRVENLRLILLCKGDKRVKPRVENLRLILLCKGE
jgi:hypothetical protein